jgi:N6-L-threonylcarbamoyladenine synthase
MVVLGIETSCDDTSIGIYDSERGVLSNVKQDQAMVHRPYEGVVPELAARAHMEWIVPVLEEALVRAKVTLDAIDGISATQGPGLIGSLLVGFSFGKALAYALKKTFSGVSHIHAHLLSPRLASPPAPFPYLCLTASGGHTLLSIVHSPVEIKQMGTTLDDAAGEAFDKIASLLGLPYPGGREMDELAQKGDPDRFSFPIAQVKPFHFSYSGLKTHVRYFLQKKVAEDKRFISDNLPDLCASVQRAIIVPLVREVRRAIKETGIQRVAIAGGVAANSYFRQELERMQEEGIEVYLTPLPYCTDNGAMIAYYGYELAIRGYTTVFSEQPYARAQTI